MAKLGLEVEGRLRGVKTLFIGASEIEAAKAYLSLNPISHVYISDPENTLNYVVAGWLFADSLVTLDVTAVRAEVRPTNVMVILTMPHSYWDSVERLRPDDQIKFHSEGRNVLCAPVRNFVPTQPIEFLGDIELEL